MKKLVAITAIAGGLLTGALLGGVLRETPAPADARSLEAQRAVARATKLQGQLRATGDPQLYPQIDRTLKNALVLDPQNAAALRGLSALAASRHRFRESLALAERARRVEPHIATVYGLLGDASLELGRYRRAFAAFDRMAQLRPSANVYARISYARELRGDLAAAIQAIRLAVDASPAVGESAAWSRTLLGNVLLADRQLQAAERSYREALFVQPGYAAAIAGRAGVLLARGELDRVLPLLRRAARAGATPELAVALGDAAAQAGRAVEARRAWREAEARERAFARHGGRNLLETAEFDLDHDRRIRDALDRARRGYRERPSIEGEHVLAWALYKNGRCAEARRYSLRSLRLGTVDIDGLYHHSLIERCLGNHAAAGAYLARVRMLSPNYLRYPPSAKQLR